MASVAMLAAAILPAEATAASPMLEFVAPGAAFPIGFEAEGGEVTAVLEGFETEVRCADSEGEGEITGPRSTESNYVFTGCKADGGGGQPCQSEGKNSEEIVAEEIEADLVYLDQAQHKVAMLLNPSEGVYMNFECGGEEVKAIGPFLAPVAGPINQLAESFTVTLESSGAQQTTTEYEGPDGEKLQAIPEGIRGIHEPAKTGVGLAFTIEPEAPLEIKAISKEEVEAKRREEEAATKKQQEEEAAAKKRQEEEAATKKQQEEEAAAKKRRERKRAQAKRRRMHTHLHAALRRCRKLDPKHKRVRCERRVRRKYGGHRGHKAHRHHRHRHAAGRIS